MAAAPNPTTKALNGRFTRNVSLGDDLDAPLRLLGVPQWICRAFSLFPINVHIDHTKDEAGVEHVDIDEIVATIPVMHEACILGERERECEHFLFGSMTTKSRRLALEEITDAYIKESFQWTEDCIEGGLLEIERWSTPGKHSVTWRLTQMVGFSVMNGERRLATSVTLTSSLKEDGPFHGRYVFDYVGAV